MRRLVGCVIMLCVYGCGRHDPAVTGNVPAVASVDPPLAAPQGTKGSGSTTGLEQAAATSAGATQKPPLSFFVSSRTNSNADLGGLAAADQRCQELAKAVDAGGRIWHAYLSVARDSAHGNRPVNARDRIGEGPWYNANGLLVAENLTALHARTGNADVFVDEHGKKINGHYPGSPTPVEHDVLTGSDANGKLMADLTCGDWTSKDRNSAAQVGHTDGIGPNGNTSPPYSSWNSAHASESCADTAPRGGAGRIYCFAVSAGGAGPAPTAH